MATNTQIKKKLPTTSVNPFKRNAKIKTPYGVFLYQGEPLASTALRIYNKMADQGKFDFYEISNYLPLTKEDIDEILTKEDFKVQIQNIKNSRRLQEAEKGTDYILSLKDKVEKPDGSIDSAVLSNYRQHVEFIEERLGKNAGYTTRTENITVTMELSPERRAQLSKIIHDYEDTNE